MKKILFMVVLSVSLMVCLTSPAWASGVDNYKAGVKAYESNLQSRTDEAIRLLTKAIASGQLSRAQLKYAYFCRGEEWQLGKKDYDKAIADFTKAIEINPKDAGSYYYRGLAWADKGDGVKAIEDYAKAKELGYK